MAGQIKRMIERVVTERSRGNPTIARLTRAKLILKGIDVEAYDDASRDDPDTLERLRAAAADLGVVL